MDPREVLREKLARRKGGGPKLTPEQRAQLVADYIAEPDIKVADLARRYGITHGSATYLLERAAR